MLQMTERQGVEIDYCPTCRGVWLDRGELDKIIDRASADQSAAVPPPAAPPPATPPPAPDPRTESAGYPGQAYAQPQYPQNPQYAENPQYRGYPQYPSSPDSPDHRGYDPRYGDQRYGKRKRRESFLGDLFDF